MIQRVQSVYLFLVTVLLSLFVVRPYAGLAFKDNRQLMLHAHAVKLEFNDREVIYKSTPLVAVLPVVSGILALVTIFMFRNRIWQIRLCLINSLILLLLIVLMYVNYTSVKNDFFVAWHSFKGSAVFPVMAVILNIMAFRAIRKDELLVKSYDRIR